MHLEDGDAPPFLGVADFGLPITRGSRVHVLAADVPSLEPRRKIASSDDLNAAGRQPDNS